MKTNRKKKRSIKLSTLQGITIGLVCLIVVIGLVANTGWGTLSAMGYGTIAAICPLGSLESMLASLTVVPREVFALLFVLAVVLLTGRAFCSWICPIPPLDRFFETKKRSAKRVEGQRHAGEIVLEKSQCTHSCAGCQSSCEQTKPKLDSRHIVLCGALGSAAIFGFPVFCLVCPIGLTFATAIAFARLVGFNEPSWGLLVFPVIVVLELTVLRKWCSHWCPMGAALSLVSRAAKLLRPKPDKQVCLRASGEPCVVCATVCPMHIDPCENIGLVSHAECTRCGRCVEACPSGALSFTPKRK